MNKHTKIAIFIAPILAILGFALADLWAENEASQIKIFELTPFGHCDIKNKQCVLKSGEFEINISDEKGITTLNTTYPLDKAMLFLVDEKNQATPYPLGMKESPYYWKRETPLGSYIAQKGQRYKLRMILEIKGGKYLAEFHTQTIK